MEYKQTLLEQEVAQLKAELENSKNELAKYKTLFQASADALSIIDLDTGKFIECNQAAIELHGVESEDNFLNLTPADISPEFQPCGKTSAEMAVEYIEKAFSEGPQVFQWEHSRLDGTTFPCLVSLTALPLSGKNLLLAIGRNISDLHKTKNALEKAFSEVERFRRAYEEEKEKFEKTVELAPVGVAINRLDTGAFDYVNQEFSRFSGYSVEELNQLDYWHLTPQKYEKQEQEQLVSLNEISRYGPYEKEYIHKKGHLYPVRLSGVKITTAHGEEFICSIVQDISQQQKFEDQLRIEKEKAESAAFKMELANDSAGIGVWEWDLRTNELIWDSWMYKLYGITSQTFSGVYEAWLQAVHPDDIDYARTKLEKAISNEGIYEPEFRVVHPDGAIRTLKASAEVIRNEQGEALKVVGVNYDISDKVNAINELNIAKQEAENANQAKSAFVANMSHEIRTPMNAILGGLQLLKAARVDPKLSVILENSFTSAKSLLVIINDILDYSKIADNKLELEQAPFSFLEVLKSIRFDVDPVVSRKGINLINKINDDFKDWWLGDSVRVKQVLLNLVSNAVKFTQNGSVTISLDSKTLQGKQAIVIEVVDTGIGMDKETQERVFERFTQADSSTTRKFGGTGLGMSITLSLINLMNGSINLDSDIGKGTKIEIILPLEKASDEEIKSADEPLVVPSFTNKKILVAEDNEMNQVLIESILESTGANITIVENGKLAVDAALKENFDLVLMDIQMPEMDGMEALNHILKTKKESKVIALTANTMNTDVAKYLKLGFLAHIGKPIEMNDLYKVMDQYLS